MYRADAIDSPTMESFQYKKVMPLIALTVVLVLRPQEIFTSLQGLRIYAGLAVACLVIFHEALLQRLTIKSLAHNPINACVIGLLPAILLSHMHQLSFQAAFFGAMRFAEILAYFVLVVAVLDSRARLAVYMRWLAVIICVSAICSLLYYYHAFGLHGTAEFRQRQYDPAIDDVYTFTRLQSFNNFGDPNDYAILLVLGMVLTLDESANSRRPLLRVVWLAAMVVVAFAFTLTKSRGGMVAGLFAISAYGVARVGTGATLLLGALSIPLLVPRLGRMGTIVTGFQAGDTGAIRFHLWHECMRLFMESPLFGVGLSEFRRRGGMGLVAHNTFLECFAELGFLGGSLFLGSYLLAILSVWHSRNDKSVATGDELLRIRPCLLGLTIGYAGGLLSLSHTLFPPAYIPLALAASYHRLVFSGLPCSLLLRRPSLTVLIVSIFFIVLCYVLFMLAFPASR